MSRKFSKISSNLHSDSMNSVKSLSNFNSDLKLTNSQKESDRSKNIENKNLDLIKANNNNTLETLNKENNLNMILKSNIELFKTEKFINLITLKIEEIGNTISKK